MNEQTTPTTIDEPPTLEPHLPSANPANPAPPQRSPFARSGREAARAKAKRRADKASRKQNRGK